MSILSYLLSVKLAETSSPYNRRIRVVRQYGKNRLIVNGAQQSGPYVEWMYRKALAAFGIPGGKPPKNVLMFGLGGGTAIRIIREDCPDAAFTVVDIDAEIIGLAKRFFGVGDIPGVTVFEGDALAFANNAVNGSGKHDLIIVDMYIGRDIPDGVSSETFLRDVRGLLAPGGDLFLNYVRDLGYEDKWKLLKQRMDSVFPFVETKKVEHNMFFHARNA